MNLFSQPDARMSIAALACAILRHFGAPAPNPVCPALAGYLENAPRNVVLLLLDGLGQNILTRHLPPDSFLRRHQVDTLSSVFPPTTTAAATALETGLFPSQSGWLGWSVFWPPIGQNVALYPNTTDDGTPAAEVHTGNTFLPVTQLVSVLRERGIDAISTYQQGAQTLEEIVDLVQTRCRAPGRHFVYAYLNEPDHHLHREGCGSEAVRQWLSRADEAMEKLENTCPDTLFLLTADHGFTDVEGLCLEDFPELEDTLLRKPSIEPRALNLFLKPGREGDFLRLWQAVMGSSYRLYSRQAVLDCRLFGPEPEHPMLESMLGDFLAVARTCKTLFPNPSYLRSMVATHGGMTEDELTVPLVIWQSRR